METIGRFLRSIGAAVKGTAQGIWRFAKRHPFFSTFMFLITLIFC